MGNNRVPIVIAFTPNYFVPACTTLKSILDSSGSEARFEVICLVTEDIPQRQKEKLRRLTGDRMDFSYVNCSGRLKGAYVDPRYSEAASYRLLLPELLPEYDKVAYIDCDVIVRNDLVELYRNTNLGNHLLAAIAEAPIENQAERWKAMGCNPEKYFNSGFLIMNLMQMREEGTSSQMMKKLKTDYLEFPDQDVLNMVCQERTLFLPPIYNSIRTFFIPQYKPDFLKRYSEKDWEEVQRHGTIHYTGGKPWNMFTMKFAEWWRCYESLPYEIKEEWMVNNKLQLLYHLLNTNIGRHLLQFSQAFYRVLKNRIAPNE